MLKSCPDPVDVQDLQFKLQCKLKIFDTKDVSAFPNSTSLLSCASRFGQIFCGSNTSNFQVIQTKCVEQYNPKDKEVTNYPRRTVPLPAPPTHICVNCDSTVLAVVYEKEKCSWVIFYDVLSFLKHKISVLKEVKLSSVPGVFVIEINWNPSLPDIFTACKSDGSLGLYELKKANIETMELPAASGATTFCWSPKGKQIAVGSRDGKITQYKPDLKAVKVINNPPLEGPHSLISLQWVSNYQFIGVYQSLQPEGPACLVVVDAPKTGDIVFTNYEDVCYSGFTRSPKFYMDLQSHWHLLMVASANSTELGILTSTNDLWTQWIIADSARAELPLNSDHQETFPIGMGFDVSSTTPLPWGESTIPPCPRLLLLSHQGLLCVFNVVNLREGIPTLCTPPSTVADTSGLIHFTTKSENSNTFVSIASTPKTPMQSEIVAPKPTFSFAPVQSAASGTPIFGGQVSLAPVSKQVPAMTVENKYSSIFAALAPNVGKPPVDTVKQKPVVISTDKMKIETQTPKTEPKKNKPELPKPDLVPVSSSDVKNAAETQQLLTQMIKDECLYIEKELRTLLIKGKSLQVNIGTESEKNDMVLKINSLQDFLNELIDISIGQSNEIQDLKQRLIQSWAWYEEARSRYNTSKDETMTLVLKSQPLDSAAEKRLKDIQHVMYYIESQLTQVSKALDEQWDQFQNYAKRRHSDKLPTMEAIFQTMVRQNVILQKQSYVLRDIWNRLKKKNQGKDGASLLVTDRIKELEKDMKNVTLGSQQVFQVQYAQVLNRTKNLTSNKGEKLRNILKNRTVHHVTAVKPQISSLTINTLSPLTKSRLSSLSSQISPIKNTAVRNLNFREDMGMISTPIPNQIPSIFSKPGSAFVATNQTMSKPIVTEVIDLSKMPENTPTSFTFSVNLFGPKTTVSTTEKLMSDVNKSSTKTVTVLQNAEVISTTTPPTQKPLFSLESMKPKMKPSENQVKFGGFPQISSSEISVPKDVTIPPVTTSSGFSLSFTSLTSKPEEQRSSFGTTTMPSSSFSFVTPKPESNLSFGAQEKGVFSKAIVTPSTAATAESKPQETTPKSLIFTSTTVSAFAKGFGMSPATTSTQMTSIFSKPSAATSQPSIFGGTSISTVTAITASTTTSSTDTLFGKPATSSLAETIGKTSANVVGQAVPTTSSIFNKPSTGTSSIFGQTTTSTLTSTTNIFGQKSTSIPQPDSTTSTNIFGKTTTAPVFGQLTTATSQVTSSTGTSIFSVSKPQKAIAITESTATTTSIFGQQITTAVSTPSIFSQQLQKSKVSTQPVTTTTPSVFASTAGNIFEPQSTAATSALISTTTSIFTSTSGTVFGQQLTTATSHPTATTTSVFASQQQQQTKASSPIFGQQPTTSMTTGLFGQTQASTASMFEQQSSIFGQQTLPTSQPTVTMTTSVFVQPVTTHSIFSQKMPTVSQPTSTPGMFPHQELVTSPSAFGQERSTVASSAPSIFGQQSVSTTNSVFGQQPATAASIFKQQANVALTTTPSVFSQQPVTAASIFGQQASTATFGQPVTATSIFGQQSSVFGSTPSTPATTSQIFGKSTFETPAFAGSPSIFGPISTTTAPNSSVSIFGSSSSTPSVFGGSTAATTTPSVFGSAPSNGSVFGSGFGAVSSSGSSVFGAPATMSTFGSQPASSGSSFGFMGLNMGNTATTTSSVFGGSTFGAQATNPFVKTEPKSSPFGSPNIFAAATSSGMPFGSNTGSTFGQAGQATFGSSTFGSPPVFGQQSKPAFGQSTFGGTSFGSPQPGPFSGGTSGTPVAQSGFGSPAAFQKPAGFGGFGSTSPAFGGAPSFGGSPTFGSSPSFGSPGKVFGTETSGTGSFGTSQAQQSAGFGNLANQNTIGFGNLAQQGNTQGAAPFSGSSSFSNWR